MEIKTIDEYILMEMHEGSKIYIPTGECKTCEEYVIKKLLKMEERVCDLEEANETLKSKNKALKEALKNCGKKITQVAKVLKGDLEPKSNNGAEAPAISVKVDFDEDDNDDNDSDDYDYDYDYDYDDDDDSNYEDAED